MKEKSLDGLPEWEKKIRLDRENKRKAKAKEERRLNRCRFIIGGLVVAVFPELLQSDLSEDSATYKKLNAALVYLKEHQNPNIFQFDMCTYTKSGPEGQCDGNVQL